MGIVVPPFFKKRFYGSLSWPIVIFQHSWGQTLLGALGVKPLNLIFHLFSFYGSLRFKVCQDWQYRKKSKKQLVVIPAKAVIPQFQYVLDAGSSPA